MDKDNNSESNVNVSIAVIAYYTNAVAAILPLLTCKVFLIFIALTARAHTQFVLTLCDGALFFLFY